MSVPVRLAAQCPRYRHFLATGEQFGKSGKYAAVDKQSALGKIDKVEAATTKEQIDATPDF
jgi:hypothetical protein